MADAKAALDATQWDDVRFLLAVLRAGSFTAAARLLGTDQSTVSRRIASLEASLGVALFERTRRAPLPTEAARELRDAAARIEAEFVRFCDDAVGIKSQSVSGRVRVATTDDVAELVAAGCPVETIKHEQQQLPTGE
jgi:DNA-binding transcriptional LysR family regulator